MDHDDPAHRIAPRANSRTLRCFTALALASLVLSACHGNDPRLAIVARSDLTPREEVDRIDVELVGVGVTTSTTVSRSSSPREGLTIYERYLAPLARRHVRVTFFLDGAEIARRDLVFDHTVDRELVIDVPRLCVDAGCEDDETCILGQCAPSTCVDGDETDCPGPMCADDSECAIEAVPCATGACSDGVCLGYGDDGACESGEWCDPLSGCAPQRAFVDAWMANPDAGGDTGSAVDVDSSQDIDAGQGLDAGEDVDAGMLGV